MTNTEAAKRFKKAVYDKVDTIDPDNEWDWHDLALGFLALGFSLDEAEDCITILLHKGWI